MEIFSPSLRLYRVGGEVVTDLLACRRISELPGSPPGDGSRYRLAAPTQLFIPLTLPSDILPDSHITKDD